MANLALESKRRYEALMQRVGRKLTHVQNKLITPQRNAEGVRMHTVGRIIQSMKNLYFSHDTDVFDPVKGFYQGFSDAGISDVTDLNARGLEDISIIGAIKSIVPIVAAERAMPQPQVTISYQRLEAVNSNHNVSAGDVVKSPFSPHDNDVDLQLVSKEESFAGVTTAKTVSFSAPIYKRAITVTIVGIQKASGVGHKGKIVGQDLNGDGKIHWQLVDTTSITSKDSTIETNSALRSDTADTDSNDTVVKIPSTVATVNYSEGSVAFLASSFEANTKVTVSATVDSTQSDEGTNILRVKPTFETSLLEAKTNQVILESSIQAEAYQKNMLQNAYDTGITVDMGETAYKHLLEMYIEYVNDRIIKAIVNAGTVAKNGHQASSIPELDLSTYGNSWNDKAQTKNDRVNNFFIELNTALAKGSGKGGTFICTGVEGVNILANIPDRFVPTEDLNLMIDGVVGTYNNLPVIRHRYIDTVSADGKVNFYLGYKSPNGIAAPIAFGEYLPLFSTKQVLNYNNPTQYSQAIFSYIGTATIVPELIVVGELTY